MPQQAARWTAEMVRALPDDGNRYEVVDRELLVRRAPAELHQRAVTQLALELGLHARQQGGFEVLVSPAGAGSPEYWIVDLDARVNRGVAAGESSSRDPRGDDHVATRPGR